MRPDPFVANRARMLENQRAGNFRTSSGARIVGSSTTLASGGVITRGESMRAPRISSGAVRTLSGNGGVPGGPFIIPGGGSPISSGINVSGGITGAVQGATNPGPSGNPWVNAGIGALTGLLSGGNGGGGAEAPSGNAPIPGLVATGGGSGPCPSGTRSILGRCVNLPGGQLTGGGMVVSGGEPVLGYYGVAMAPMVESRTHRSCPRGMVLGNDGLCYQKNQLTKREREHAPPRKPLLTGGDLNAISRASRVAKSLERKTKQLQSMGMIKKPTPRRRSC